MQEGYTLLDVPEKKSVMSLKEEISLKMETDPRWKLIPKDYAVNCIALLLTFEDAIYGLRKHLSPEELMFEIEGFDEEKIRQWRES